MAKTKNQSKAVKTSAGFVPFRSGGKKSHSGKNSKLKQGASSGKARVTGNAQPSYSVLPSSTVALPPGQGPPMSSTQAGGRASTSAVISALRKGAPKKRGKKK